MAKHRGIFRRGDVWWYRYADATGKIRRKSSYSTSYKRAEELLLEARTAISKGIDPEAQRKEAIQKQNNFTFADLAVKYLAWLNDRQASAEMKTYIIKRLQEREIFLPENGGTVRTVPLGSLPLRSFNTYLVEQLQSSLKKKGLKKPQVNKSGKVIEPGPLKDTSINRILSTVKHMFSKAVEWELVEEDVLKKIRKVKLPKEIGRFRYLSAQEANVLVSACNDYLQPVVITALHTGMRKQEILKLKWCQVDLQHGFILLDKTKNMERREIPINNTLRATFNKLPRRFVEKKGVKELVQYLFHDEKTLKPFDSVKRSFGTAVKNAGIMDFHFHDLRHTFASLAMMSGKIDIATLSKILGHKSLKMTMKYAHLAPAHLQKAVFVMDDVYRVPTDTKLTHQNEKGLTGEGQPIDNLVELRGIEPLTPRLPVEPEK